MLEMKIEWDYVVVDAQEWIDDRTDGVNDEATEAFDAWMEEATSEDTYGVYESTELLKWLATLDATGVYGESDPWQICTYNVETFLSDDGIITFAKTERYGDLFIWQDGYMMSSTPTIYTFNGGDDSDAFEYAGGYASCDMEVHSYKDGDEWPYGGCDAEWIVESACTIWQNGGGQTERISDVLKVSEVTGNTYAVCPRCHMGNLTFWAS